MQFEEYVAARYGRLIEHAVLLGCAEGEAGTYVDQVLLEQKKKIRRSGDPDPIVHAALERKINGQREEQRSTGPFVALALVVVVVVVAVALTWQPSAVAVPTLFALEEDQAVATVEAAGFEAVLRPARACEPDGLVLGADPEPGTLAREGSTVTIRTAVPSGPTCDAEYGDRSDAWAFVRFALGGEPPAFARTVRVVVDRGDDVPVPAPTGPDDEQWMQTLDSVARVARTMPELVVTDGVPPSDTCGTPRPVEAGERRALRLRFGSEEAGCVLTIDLYRDSDDVIDAVVIYRE